MRVVSRKALVSYFTEVPAATEYFEDWYAVVSRASWSNFAQVKADFPQTDLKTVDQADAQGGKKKVTFLIFDVHGNHYRIVCAVHFNTQTLFVRYAGDHKGYDRLDLKKL